jgi:endonuclease YncB( thermonuclease family)
MRTSKAGRALVFAFGAVFSFGDAYADPLIAGKVIGIQDGDTITLLDMDLTRYRIRLAGIDAPEKSQAFGRVSQVHLSTLCYGKLVTANCPKVDQYGRRVCTVFVNGVDVNLAQVVAGLAWHYKRFVHEQSAHERGAYAKAEDAARAGKVGLWKDRDPIPPWEWRALRRVLPRQQ